MALVAGVNIPDNKRVDISLQTVYGVGPAVAKRVVEEAALPGNPRVRELSEEELNRLRGALDRSGAIIEGDLRREVQMNVRRLIDIGSYRGLRHRRGLPARGQRTKTNARTKRGRRRAIANKKKVGH
ncbi:MAG TPA: 30S ribosomal protein S13 [Dehalococcoidia bacterium]|jgi:small subunit ribosomal protein S13|nr:30S ribosomal protein S13 [Chloroflexota bacterium]MDP5877275.1 30S ribosomal protein S13 [Dehalococcoidia bacterium]MDP6273665.1 30S ribosomal protein S13 [Dehalococcoidia bacterium]MDP7159936.1 30S ribosomal protein S13 [Dehalococcoidia bacterium]MDP7212448.1 30S ribosomal protein S13 [Dehalococcoidia bacterium]|tara:strand:- start:404 stop:784 length:381 start_codon:yes stop_codon:yes gene_type:complete